MQARFGLANGSLTGAAAEKMSSGGPPVGVRIRGAVVVLGALGRSLKAAHHLDVEPGIVKVISGRVGEAGGGVAPDGEAGLGGSAWTQPGSIALKMIRHYIIEEYEQLRNAK